MSRLNRVVVLIIAHKESLTKSEKDSLYQCHHILSKHPIKLICPHGLNMQDYRSVIPDIEVDFINPKWQASYQMFNRLKIDPFIYNRYKKYEFILFYELDAWVFRDELSYWCDKNYDYIGAPWYEDSENGNNNFHFTGVGNGGFSLRKIKSHLKVLRSFSYIYSPITLMRETCSNNGRSFKSYLRILANFTSRNNTLFLSNDYRHNEDHFWGVIVGNKFKWFRLPDEKTAYQFSMELRAPDLYKRNNNQLPFGCHAWEKYNSEFWQKHVLIT
ncbi:MAG: hypothetical protein JWN56_1421 [Sphingobacteriales bacterium]|nr:hypothetical protein [Sphingobacteriales bacterium]